MHGCTQVLHIISCIFGKLGLFFKVTILLKPEFYQMYLRQNVSKLTYKFTLRPCLSVRKEKNIKRQVFRVKLLNRSRHQANRLNQPGYWLTDSLCPVEECKNTLSHLVTSSSRSRFPPSRSTSSRGPVEATVTCQSIKCFKGQ